jgi:protein SCO1
MHRALVLLLVLAVSGCAHGTPVADFTLQNDASPWSLSAQRGKAVVLTFGYTHCTDTCPVTLAKLAQTVRTLGPRASGLEVVFVTVDPHRDTPAVLRAYLRKFDGGFVGLTGTPGKIAAVEKAYHLWAQRIPGKRVGGYDEAHGDAIFFIDGRGDLSSLHDGADSVEDLTQAAGAMLG